MKTSNFGRGFIYCLINFAKHFDKALADRNMYKIAGYKESESLALSAWINGASDHLFELEIPKNLPNPIKKRVFALQNSVLEYGHGAGMLSGNFTKEKYEAMRAELNEISLAIDKWLGVKIQKAEWD